MKELFDISGSWFKGNLHMHTTLSDGCLSPEEALGVYQRAGYDFVALTDHRKPCKSGMYENMLILSAAEWDYGNNTDFPVYHILAVGTDNDLGLPEVYQRGDLPCSDRFSPQGIVNRINAVGALAILAHPKWSVMSPEEMFKLDGITAAEIYNSVSGTPFNADRADSSHYFDIWASKGRNVFCTAADDSHWYKGEHTRSYIMVNAPELTEKSIVSAIKNGNFYASQGPEIYSVKYDSKTVTAEFSTDVSRVVVYSNSVWVDERVFDEPNGSVSYKIAPSDRYVRLELITPDGKKAWTSPFSV